jgi:hypothetical protein
MRAQQTEVTSASIQQSGQSLVAKKKEEEEEEDQFELIKVVVNFLDLRFS